MIRAGLLGAVMVLGGAWADSTATPIGRWARQDGLSRISISPCGDAFCAVNTWVRDPEGHEQLGDTLVMTLRQEAPTELSGKAYDRRRDMTYSMTLTLGPGSMRTRGCVMLGLLCRTADWTRLP